MKILVVCNAGMSSSILVKKIREYAQSIGEAITIEAMSSTYIEEETGNWDVCLVGPQLMHAVDEIHDMLEIPTESVEMRTYAMADGKAAYEQAKRLSGAFH